MTRAQALAVRSYSDLRAQGVPPGEAMEVCREVIALALGPLPREEARRRVRLCGQAALEGVRLVEAGR